MNAVWDREEEVKSSHTDFLPEPSTNYRLEYQIKLNLDQVEFENTI